MFKITMVTELKVWGGGGWGRGGGRGGEGGCPIKHAKKNLKEKAM